VGLFYQNCFDRRGKERRSLSPPLGYRPNICPSGAVSECHQDFASYSLWGQCLSFQAKSQATSQEPNYASGMPKFNFLPSFTHASAAILLIGALSGCSASGNTPSSTTTQGTSAPMETELDPLAQALLAVEASYELFQSAGMTETVDSGGDAYVLSYDPSNPEFVAALYNLSFDDVIPVEEKELFTVYATWLYVNDGSSVVELTPTGISVTNDVSSPFQVVIENGLIVSGSAIDGSWTGTFNYQPDLEVLARLSAEG
jgi:hypothetical protein